MATLVLLVVIATAGITYWLFSQINPGASSIGAASGLATAGAALATALGAFAPFGARIVSQGPAAVGSLAERLGRTGAQIRQAEKQVLPQTPTLVAGDIPLSNLWQGVWSELLREIDLQSLGLAASEPLTRYTVDRDGTGVPDRAYQASRFLQITYAGHSPLERLATEIRDLLKQTPPPSSANVAS